MSGTIEFEKIGGGRKARKGRKRKDGKGNLRHNGKCKCGSGLPRRKCCQ
jgi:hypothetical protein